MQTLEQFIKKYDVWLESKRVYERMDGLMSDSAGMRHFRCRLWVSRERSFGLYFSQGSAHKQDPTTADVLDCLASDAAGYENAQTFEEWASEYSYDPDSRKAELIFKTVKRQAEQLRRMLGQAAYDALLWDTERA